VDSGQYWSHLREDIAAAKESIYVQSMTFDADRSGRLLADALLAAAAPDRRILIDTVSQYIVSDRFAYAPWPYLDDGFRKEWRDTRHQVIDLRRHGIGVKITNPFGPLWLRFLSRNHKKLVMLDGRIAYIGGINFSDHNFAWHDMMLRIEDPEVAEFLEGDFLHTWAGNNRFAVKSFRGLDILLANGRTNSDVFSALMDVVRRAEKNIFIESTYFGLPFFNWLREIGPARPETTLLVSQDNNWGPMRHYIPWEAWRSGVRLRLYPDRLTHLKAILVDDRTLIMGSSNFEFFSYALYQEIAAVIQDPGVIDEFREKVMLPDLQKSLPFQGRIHPLRGYNRALQFRFVTRLSRLFTYL
jgi:cardiolipin synthase